MAYSQTIISGTVGRDMEMKESQGGMVYGKFSVAVSRGKDKATDWYEVTAFGNTAVWNEEKVLKGAKVWVVGRMQANKVEGKGTYWGLIADRIDATPKAHDGGGEANWDDLAKNVPL